MASCCLWDPCPAVLVPNLDVVLIVLNEPCAYVDPVLVAFKSQLKIFWIEGLKLIEALYRVLRRNDQCSVLYELKHLIAASVP